jgi:hypothetical protein
MIRGKTRNRKINKSWKGTGAGLLDAKRQDCVRRKALLNSQMKENFDVVDSEIFE